jgi:hypothetical protein
MKYTPGPWEVDFSEKYYKPCIRHNGMIVCTLPHNPIGINGTDERKGDARLIAAAPEMYELAKHITAMFDDAYLNGHPEWEEIVKEAFTALAKAEGR